MRDQTTHWISQKRYTLVYDCRLNILAPIICIDYKLQGIDLFFDFTSVIYPKLLKSTSD